MSKKIIPYLEMIAYLDKANIFKNQQQINAAKLTNKEFVFKYLSLYSNEIINRVLQQKTETYVADRLPFSTKRINDQLRSMNRKSILDQKYSLITKTKRQQWGNKNPKANSVAEYKLDYHITAYMQFYNWLSPEDAYAHHMSKMPKNAGVDYIKIDADSLSNFAANTYDQLVKSSNTTTGVRLLRDYVQAFRLIALNEYCVAQNMPGIPQYYNAQYRQCLDYYPERYIYTGINLQGCSKAVRTAALGNTVEIDIRACSWSYYAMLCNTYKINNYAAFSYINNIDATRKSLAAKLTVNAYSKAKLEFVKASITAIGFGASNINSFYDLIKSPTDRTMFLSDPIVKALLALYKKLEKAHVADESLRVPGLKNIPKFQKVTYHRQGPMIGEVRSRSFCPKKFMSHQYRCHETEVMDYVSNTLLAPGAVLLRVHDAVYIQYDVKEEYKEIKTFLEKNVQDSFNPHIRFGYNIYKRIERSVK